MHPLLTKQLKRKLASKELREEFAPLNDAISETYNDFENERALLERSLQLVSEELNERNAELKKKLMQLNDTHDRLGDSMAVLDSIFDATGEAIFAFNQDGALIRFNLTGQELFNLTDVATVEKQISILQLVENFIKDPAIFVHELRRLALAPKMPLFGVLELTDGRLFEYHSSAQVSNKNLVGRVWCFRNVTQIKKNEALVLHQAFHDSLTNLPNRTLFLERIKHAIAISRRCEDSIAVLFIDLDHFKKVNDTSGHQVGDTLLIEVTKRINSCLRQHDTLSRFGGDEFVVLLEQITSHREPSRVGKRIIEQLKVPFVIDGKSFHISSSIGISIYPRDDLEPDELIRKADLAMYHAKENGRSKLEFFAKPLERIAKFQLELENKLRLAIKNNEFCVYYQPLVETKTRKFTKMEALLRWLPETELAVSPTQFIPVAENAGLIGEIGLWVIRDVCNQIIQWNSLGFKELRVSINLSAHQFTDAGLFDKIKAILVETNVSGEHLEFEITETLLVENLDKVNAILVQLRAMGITIAIDDFGTGYSSLKYLQKLPIDNLKIDRSFIQELSQTKNDQSIVKAIISLGHSMQLNVVAEGVEDKAMFEYLRALKCDYIQGYYFHKPMSSDALTVLLAQ